MAEDYHDSGATDSRIRSYIEYCIESGAPDLGARCRHLRGEALVDERFGSDEFIQRDDWFATSF